MDLSMWLLGAINYSKFPRPPDFLTTERMFSTLSSSLAGRTWSPMDTDLPEKNRGLWYHRKRSKGVKFQPTGRSPNSDSQEEDRHQEWGPVRECWEGQSPGHAKQKNGLCSTEAIEPCGLRLLPTAHMHLLWSQDVTATLASAAAIKRA